MASLQRLWVFICLNNKIVEVYMLQPLHTPRITFSAVQAAVCSCCVMAGTDQSVS